MIRKIILEVEEELIKVTYTRISLMPTEYEEQDLKKESKNWSNNGKMNSVERRQFIKEKRKYFSNGLKTLEEEAIISSAVIAENKHRKSDPSSNGDDDLSESY